MLFILKIFLISSLGLTVISETCLESKEMEDNCGSYCFKVVKPLLDHVYSLKRYGNNNDDIQKMDSHSKVENMDRTLAILQGKVETLERLSCKSEIRPQWNKFQKTGSKYYYIEEHEQVTWFTAVHKCHAMGAHLASIQNENEFELLKAKLNVERNYWIDINDLSKEGEFLSHTTGLKAPYFNWYPSYNPDNNGGIEHCVHLWNLEQKFRMNDEPCSSLLCFICEI